MGDSIENVREYIETENAFQVMAELKRHGILTKDDVSKAFGMSREEWLQFMKEKAGVADED